MDTREEFSAGGVVYAYQQPTTNNQQPIFLLGKHSGYHKWVLPKGLIEQGEKPEETAVRETEEEMGVVAKLAKPDPIHIERYSYTADYKIPLDISLQTSQSSRRVKNYQETGGSGVLVNKTVTLYLMEWVSGDPQKDHGWEMEEAGWFDYKTSLEMMGFEGEKKALEKAMEILLK